MREAEDALELVRAFMNSVDVEAGTDAFDTPEGLRAWLAGLPGAAPYADGGVVTTADLARARELREALRRLARANHDRTVDAEALATVNRFARETPLLVRLAGETPNLVPAGEGVTAFFGELLGALFLAMHNGTWSRLKICAADDCQWAFFDASKNRSGTWCSMKVCGNRAKVRKYQQRRRAREQGTVDGRAGEL